MSQVDAFAKERAYFRDTFKAEPTDQTLMLLDIAKEEADRFMHDATGTEHILIGACLTPGSAELLADLGAETTKVRSATEFIIGRGHRATRTGNRGLTLKAKEAITSAVSEAERLSDPEIRPTHMVLGILQSGEGIAAGVLESLGIGLTKARERVLETRRLRPEDLNAGTLSTVNDAFEGLAGVRMMLLNPDISRGYKANIGAVLKQLNQTYNPRPKA